MNLENVTEFPQRAVAGNGGNYSNLDNRLGAVELEVRALKTNMQQVATKAGVPAGVLGGMGIAAGIATTIAIALVRLLSD